MTPNQRWYISPRSIVAIIAIAIATITVWVIISAAGTRDQQQETASRESLRSEHAPPESQERDPRVALLYDNQKAESASARNSTTAPSEVEEDLSTLPPSTTDNAVLQPSHTTSTVDPLLSALLTPLAGPTPSATSISDNPLIDSLRALKEPSDSEREGLARDRFNPGVRRSSGSTSVVPTPTPTPSSDLPWVTGQATGIASLAFMHPKARLMAEAQISTMLKSRVRNLFLAVLADGTFGSDQQFLQQASDQLSADGRSLTLVLYLSNGPTMRRYDSTPITAAFARMSPDYFRYAIRYEGMARQKFIELAQQSRATVEHVSLANPNNRVILVPSLEDNLDLDGYTAIRDLTRGVFGDRPLIVRNICPGCWPGNDSESLGAPVEVHTLELLEQLSTQDGFTMDGIGYRYPEELDDTEQLSLERTRAVKELAIARGIHYFGLWRKQRQGLGTQRIHPDDRIYEIPNEAQVQFDIELLRHGLTEESTR